MQFTFDQRWVVKKYDQHTYFQGLSGAGLKGVDFIGIGQGQLLLMEVKNFCSRPEATDKLPITPFLDQPELLVDIFEEKVKDTLKAIATIKAYYDRSWLYRLSYPVIARMPVSKIDRIFWTHAHALLLQPAQLWFVLWLEVDPPQTGLLTQLEPILKERLSPLADHVYLSSSQFLTFKRGLTVSLIS